MGILDKKTRFIDLVVTQEGKRQIAAGKLKAEFASLSDCNAFYDKSESDSVQNRLYFEVLERPENAIVLEKDDSGVLFPFDFSPTGSIVGDDIFKGEVVSNVVQMKAATGSQFASSQAEILDASLKHFVKNYFIGTEDPQERNNFELSNKEITFTISNTQPFLDSPYKEVINVDDAEPFFLDSKLAHIPNFQFLPPVNEDGSNYGVYEDLRSTTRESWDDIKAELGDEFSNVSDDLSGDNTNLLDNLAGPPGYLSQKLLQNGQLPQEVTIPRKQVETILFNKTSTDNNLLIQVYEDSDGPKMTKLDVVDAGVFNDPSDPNNRTRKRVFYIGKVFFDTFKVPTFVNIFTIIMD